MEIVGKVVGLGNLNEGTSARGAWRKQELIIETIEQFPKKVCLVCWGDRVSEAQNFVVGQTIKAQISIESREFNGKWYTDVRPFRFDVENPQQSQPVQQMQQTTQIQQFAAQTYEQPMNNIPVTEYFETDNGDDLPF